MTRLTQETFNTLPTEVQQQVLSTLRVYDTTYVDLVDGNWEVSPHAMLSATPRQVISFGQAYQEDFYTKEEIKQIIRELDNCEWF